MSAPQNLHGTFSLLLSFGTIWSRPHLGQVRFRRRIVAKTLEKIRPIGGSFTVFDNTRCKNAFTYSITILSLFGINNFQVSLPKLLVAIQLNPLNNSNRNHNIRGLRAQLNFYQP